ncbi:MAG: MGH1-like glycoside hydrolase domain-containing protein [Planctomycetota bacterium]
MSEYSELQKDLAAGWNTWNTFSIFSHVHLPEGFTLNLAFRDDTGANVLRSGYIGHYEQTEANDLSLPGPRSYDGRYTELEVTWRGNRFTVQSATEGNDLVLLISPEEDSGLPPLVAAEAALLWNREGSLGREGDALVGRCADTEFRAYGTKEPVREPYLRASGPYLAFRLDSPVGLSIGRRRELSVIRRIVETACREVADERRRFGELQEVYDAMQTCLAWNTIYDPLGDRVISPVSRVWNAGWNGYVLFCWDTYFAGLMAGLDNRELAYANVVEMTREMTERGFVPNFASGSRGSSEDRSQPPVGSRVALDLYRRWGDEWFLAEIFDGLLRWNRWWAENRITGRWLGWGSNAFTGRLGQRSGGTLRAAVLESGLDNSPLYDTASYDPDAEVMQMADAGLTGMYVMDCRALAKIADALGREEAAELRRRAARFASALEDLWNEKAGIYLNRHTDTGVGSPRMGPPNFYPLCGGVPSQQQAERMVEEHLLNPDEFWGEWVLPSISRNDPGFEDQKYWRGRVWGPMNQIVYWGLLEYDLPEARRKLAAASAHLLLKEWREHRHVHENYNSITGEGCDARSSNRFYHWGGLLGLIPLMEAGHCGPAE